MCRRVLGWLLSKPLSAAAAAAAAVNPSWLGFRSGAGLGFSFGLDSIGAKIYSPLFDSILA